MTSRFVVTANASAFGNGVECSVDLLLDFLFVLLFDFNLRVNLLKMFTKHQLKLEMFAALFWSNGKMYISIVRSTVPLVDHSVVKVGVLTLS